jgi:ornithine carbamoyltransferase
MMKDLLRVADLSPVDLDLLLDEATAAKGAPYLHADLLRGDSVALYFIKPSTPTRSALQTAVARLGGVSLAMGPGELQLARDETIEDTARMASRSARAIVVHGFADAKLSSLAAAASVPVINALTDGHDPCQTVAALLTLRERWGVLAGHKVAYVGDGGNVANSLLEAAPLAGMDVAVATPHGLEPHPEVVARARALAAERGSRVHLACEPTGAVRDADAVVTDAWMSLHDPERARQARAHVLERFRVDRRLLACAKPDALFLHCLPAYRGREVTSEVIDGPRSLVLEQAANLLPVAQAVLSTLLGGKLQGRKHPLAVPDDSPPLVAALAHVSRRRDHR